MTSHVASMASTRPRESPFGFDRDAVAARASARLTVSLHAGQDADLMFLSLALHAPRVYVLRERVNTGRSKSTGPPRLQYLSAQRLRHCLVRDPGINGLCTQQLDPRNKLSRFERDDERLLDDFVLLCFFVGNDFLPQLPCLSIPDGGLDLLLALYSRALPRSLGGYLTDDGGERGYPCGAGRVHVKRVAALLAVIADLEPEILRRRARRDAQSSSKSREPRDAKKDALVEMAARACGKFDALSLDDDDLREPTQQEAASTKHLAERAVQKHAEKLLKESDLNDPCIGQKGFRERYYRKVLKHGPVKREGVHDRESAIRDLSVEYWRGVRFVAEYYHRGCASWSWCYPWHYAPLARDLARVALEPGEGLRKCCTRFERGAPLPPLQQLMCVLPPASAHCCPRAAQRLMTDTHSPLAKFYPRDFPLDPNGKPANLRWLWVALVPPIDVQVVASTFASQIQPTLTPDERRRNRNGPAELVCAIPPNAGTNWVALAESDPLQGSVRLLDHVRVAYRPPEMAPNEPPYQYGNDATEDLLADPRLYQNQGRAPRLPIGDEAFRKAMSDVDAMAKRGGRPPAVPVPHKVVPCRYFLQGKCHRGAACTFKHVRPDGSEVCEPVRQAPKPPVVKVLKKPQPPPAP